MQGNEEGEFSSNKSNSCLQQADTKHICYGMRRVDYKNYCWLGNKLIVEQISRWRSKIIGEEEEEIESHRITVFIELDEISRFCLHHLLTSEFWRDLTDSINYEDQQMKHGYNTSQQQK